MKSPRFHAASVAGFALVLATLAAPATADEAPGRQVFEAEKCGLCHTVSAVGIEAKTKSDTLRGPDLSGFVHDDPASVIAYLRQEASPDGERHRRKAKASDEEMRQLLAWLASLDPPPDPGTR